MDQRNSPCCYQPKKETINFRREKKSQNQPWLLVLWLQQQQQQKGGGGHIPTTKGWWGVGGISLSRLCKCKASQWIAMFHQKRERTYYSLVGLPAIGSAFWGMEMRTILYFLKHFLHFAIVRPGSMLCRTLSLLLACNLPCLLVGLQNSWFTVSLQFALLACRLTELLVYW